MLLCGLLFAYGAYAQTPISEGSTIRVYANLLQIPVLILSQRHQPLPPIAASKFTVRLDAKPPFSPKAVRQQGEDPITLAILLDHSSADSLAPALLESLPEMADKQLSGRDRVALYAMDGCRLRRFSMLLPASGPIIADSVRRALGFPPDDPSRHVAKHCDELVGLWDAVDYLTRTLADEPGRRVVLTISNGLDLGSRVQPQVVRRDANRNGVAVFTIAERYKVPLLDQSLRRINTKWEVKSWLEEISEGSGGMVTETTRNNLPYTLSHFVQLLRGRYIVEFTRPAGLAGGTSVISIACGQPRAFIRPAGTSVPISDPGVRDDAIPHEPANAEGRSIAEPGESCAACSQP